MNFIFSRCLSRNRLLIFLVFTSLLIFTVRIGDGSLYHWDEGGFAQIAKEILRRNDWVTLYWEGKEYFAKPPLILWLIAIRIKFSASAIFQPDWFLRYWGLEMLS